MADKTLHGLGRRKTAIAQVKLTDNASERLVNGKNLTEYFNAASEQLLAVSPLAVTSTDDTYGIQAKVLGGGKKGQAEAIRFAISRALLEADPEYRKQLKQAGMLTRDARRKERKKPGLKAARRAPQFSKR